jgi:CRISPR-associated protein Csb1
MSEAEKKKLTPADVLKGESPLVLTATLEPIVGDRFQPAGFPEIGHVIYKAPRKDGSTENVCIVDSAASMANHLETVCQRGAHDLELVDELIGMPYIRCVTGDLVGGKLPNDKRETIVTSLTEGHRIASSYFLDGSALSNDDTQSASTWKEDLKTQFGLVLANDNDNDNDNDKKKAHPPPDHRRSSRSTCS